jgi:hypothetical protein
LLLISDNHTQLLGVHLLQILNTQILVLNLHQQLEIQMLEMPQRRFEPPEAMVKGLSEVESELSDPAPALLEAQLEDCTGKPGGVLLHVHHV